MAHFEALAGDSRYQAPMVKLVRYLSPNVVNLNATETRTLARRKSNFQEKFAGERCAVVALSDLDFGIARSHEGYKDNDGIEFYAFRNVPAALQWLQIDPTDEVFATWFEEIEHRIQTGRIEWHHPPAPPSDS